MTTQITQKLKDVETKVQTSINILSSQIYFRTKSVRSVNEIISEMKSVLNRKFLSNEFKITNDSDEDYRSVLVQWKNGQTERSVKFALNRFKNELDCFLCFRSITTEIYQKAFDAACEIHIGLKEIGFDNPMKHVDGIPSMLQEYIDDDCYDYSDMDDEDFDELECSSVYVYRVSDFLFQSIWNLDLTDFQPVPSMFC